MLRCLLVSFLCASLSFGAEDPFDDDGCAESVADLTREFLAEIRDGGGPAGRWEVADQIELALRRTRHRIAEERYSWVALQAEWLQGRHAAVQAAIEQRARFYLRGNQKKKISPEKLRAKIIRARHKASRDATRHLPADLFRSLEASPHPAIHGLKIFFAGRPVSLEIFESVWSLVLLQRDLLRYLLVFAEAHEALWDRPLNRPFLDPSAQARISAAWAAEGNRLGRLTDVQPYITPFDIDRLFRLHVADGAAEKGTALPDHSNQWREDHYERFAEISASSAVPRQVTSLLRAYFRFGRDFSLPEYTLTQKLMAGVDLYRNLSHPRG